MKTTDVLQQAEDLYSEHKDLVKAHEFSAVNLEAGKEILSELTATATASKERHAELEQKLKRRRPLGISLPGAKQLARNARWADEVAWDEYMDTVYKQNDVSAMMGNKLVAKMNLDANEQAAVAFAENNPELQDIAAQEAIDAGIPLQRRTP